MACALLPLSSHLFRTDLRHGTSKLFLITWMKNTYQHSWFSTVAEYKNYLGSANKKLVFGSHPRDSDAIVWRCHVGIRVLKASQVNLTSGQG